MYLGVRGWLSRRMLKKLKKEEKAAKKKGTVRLPFGEIGKPYCFDK